MSRDLKVFLTVLIMLLVAGIVVYGVLTVFNKTANDSLANETGVYIYNQAKLNQIGGREVTEMNILSGNTHSGVYIANTGTRNNRILGNYIGTAIFRNIYANTMF